MKILFTRHGQTDWNAQMKIQGQVEVPLNEIGIKQANDLKEKLKDTHIDVIYSSPLERAFKTASIVNEYHGVEILTDERILEQYYGKQEGQPRSLENQTYQKQRASFAKRYPGGESYFDVAYRVYGFIHDLVRKHKGQTILVVAHGGISRIFNSYFYDMENEEFVKYGLDNCEVKTYEIPDEN